jgi:hypothetical protein
LITKPAFIRITVVKGAHPIATGSVFAGQWPRLQASALAEFFVKHNEEDRRSRIDPMGEYESHVEENETHNCSTKLIFETYAPIGSWGKSAHQKISETHHNFTHWGE